MSYRISITLWCISSGCTLATSQMIWWLSFYVLLLLYTSLSHKLSFFFPVHHTLSVVFTFGALSHSLVVYISWQWPHLSLLVPPACTTKLHYDRYNACIVNDTNLLDMDLNCKIGFSTKFVLSRSCIKSCFIPDSASWRVVMICAGAKLINFNANH